MSVSLSSKRLNLGCGHTPLCGYVNIDAYASEADVHGDIRLLEYHDVDEVLMSHVLEHISWREVPDLLKHVHGWMRPKGLLTVEVPDMGRILPDAMRNPDWIRYVWGSQEHEGECHRTGFTVHTLTKVLHDAGFVVREVQAFRSTYRTRVGMPCITAKATA